MNARLARPRRRPSFNRAAVALVVAVLAAACSSDGSVAAPTAVQFDAVQPTAPAVDDGAEPEVDDGAVDPTPDDTDERPATSAGERVNIDAIGNNLPCTPGPNPSIVDPFPVDWMVGDARNLVTVKIDQNGRRSRTPGTVEIIDGTDDGFVLRWQNEATTVEGLSDDEERSMARFSNPFEGIPIDYRVDLDGWFIEVVNRAEVQAGIDETLALFTEMARNEMSADEAAQFETLVEAMRSNPELIAAASESMQLFHSVHGLPLAVGVADRFESELPNPFGGPPFPAVATLLAEGHDDQGCAQILYETSPDNALFFDVLFDSLAAGAGEGAIDFTVEDEADLADAGMMNSIRVAFDEGTGWPREVSSTVTTSIGAIDRSEQTIILDLGPSVD